jgi:hypothetical protein
MTFPAIPTPSPAAPAATAGTLSSRGVRTDAEQLVRPTHADVASRIGIASLFTDDRLDRDLLAMQRFASAIGAVIDCQAIPPQLAREGTVGRIGVPRDAVAMMRRQRVVLGATGGADPLAPVTRLWRGLQRRADVQVDLRSCSTLPGSQAWHAGIERDVLLLSQRLLDRGTSRKSRNPADDAAGQWTRAREAADLAYRIAAAEGRHLLLVTPVGRSTEAQQFFTDALERQARLQRVASPRVVKAGLLAALLSGDTGRERWLVASVMSIDELSAMATEAVGETGPWPVLSLGRDASFYTMPSAVADAPEPVALLLVLEQLLQRSGRAELSRQLMASLRLTMAALARTREEFGAPLALPMDEFLQAITANWGRAPLPGPVRDRRTTDRTGDVGEVLGLRLRIESSRTAAEIREQVTAALHASGLEVASVRSIDAAEDVSGPLVYDVRVRTRLGETTLSDDAATALFRALDERVRCTAVEPWQPATAATRVRVPRSA